MDSKVHNQPCLLNKPPNSPCPFCCRHFKWNLKSKDYDWISEDVYCGQCKGSDTPDGSSRVSLLKKCAKKKKKKNRKKC